MAGDWLDEAAPHLSPGSGLRQAINAAKEGKVNSLPRGAEVQRAVRLSSKHEIIVEYFSHSPARWTYQAPRLTGFVPWSRNGVVEDEAGELQIALGWQLGGLVPGSQPNFLLFPIHSPTAPFVPSILDGAAANLNKP